MVRRVSAIDPTLTIERLARRMHDASVPHPVAAAVAQAARGCARMSPTEFATLLGITTGAVERSEAGDVAFGDLLPQLGLAVAMSGADLLGLADLEAQWRHHAVQSASGH